MLTELAQVAGIPLGAIRLIGAEIIFGSDIVGNSRGRVWLPLQASNHLIYGKNGVGKSTVVELLRCALTGEEPLDIARIDLFIELDESVPLPIRKPTFEVEVIDGFDSDSEDSFRPPFSLDPESDEQGAETDSDENQKNSEHNFDLTVDEQLETDSEQELNAFAEKLGIEKNLTITDEKFEEVIALLKLAEPAQMDRAIELILTTNITSDQAVAIASSPELLAAMTQEQTEAILEAFSVEDLTGEQGLAIIEAVREARVNEEDYLYLDTDNLVTAVSKSDFFQEICPAGGMQFEAFDEIQQLISRNDEGIDMQQFVSRSWDDLSGVSLRQARNTWLSYCLLTDKNSEFDHNEKSLSKVAGAYREAASQNYYCLTPVGKTGAPEWELTIACKASPETPALNDLCNLIEVCRETASIEASSQCNSPEELASWVSESDFLWAALPSSAFTDWEEPTTQFLGPPQEHPFRKLRPWMERPPRVKADDLNWNDLLEVLNLSDFFDYSKWCLEMSKTIFPNSPDQSSWTAIFSNGPDQTETSIESSKLVEYEKIVQDAAEAVSKMDINVLDVRIQTNRDFTKWISGQGIELQAKDATTGSWVDFIYLSSAQQHIISSVIRLLQPKAATNDGSPPFRIVFGDEPDRNMHQTAIRHFYKFLDQTETCSYLSTHSAVALSLPSFSRLHAYRIPSGNIRLVPWTPKFLANSEGIDLGVDRVALLSAVSLVILVEGAHDEEAIRLLLSLTDIQISSRVLVLPWRGHRTMHTIADSYVWMNMTDARILVVVDNSRAQIINKWCAVIEKLITEERPQSAITRELRENSGLSGEEETLRDLLERSIQNGVTDRVFAFGFSRGDIIEYADPSDFGLKQSWHDLRRDYQRSNNRTPFKDWLRNEHKAHISTKTVKAAFANLDHLDSDLVALLQQINDIS